MATDFLNTESKNEYDVTNGKSLAQAVLRVLTKLGGEDWLLAQAMADPKMFTDLLKKILPNNIDLGGIDGINFSLIQAYMPGAPPLTTGNVIEINDKLVGAKIATSGSESEGTASDPKAPPSADNDSDSHWWQ